MSSYGFPKKLEDAAASSGDALMPAGAVRKDGNDTALTGADGDYSWIAVNDVGNLKIQNEPSRKATYAASTGTFTLAASATDFFAIYGSGTKTVKILKIYINQTHTDNALYINNVSLIKRSTAFSGGTAANPTKVPLDSANAAATATVSNFTANPTPGTGVGTVITWKIESFCTAASTYGNLPSSTESIKTCIFDADKFGQPLVLRGTGEGLALNNGAATQGGTGPLTNVDIVWTEE